MRSGVSYSCIAAVVIWVSPAQALSVDGGSSPEGTEGGPAALSDPYVQLAQGTEETPQEAEPVSVPEPGELLVIPQNSLKAEPGSEAERKCMTVCVRWGEECMLINKGAGGMERKCRRTCTKLGEECL